MIPFIRTAVLVMCIGICGCSKGNDSAINVGVSGKHPAGWAVTSNGGNHPAMFLSAPDKCKECHGTDLRGGITKVDCFGSCHAQGPYGHAPGWSDAAAHGAHAKATVAGVDGMGFCTNCHGVDFRGGTAGISCFGCHNASPHAIPWLISTGATTYLHSTAASTNAFTCGGCHGGGAKLSTPIAPPVNASCFNNTLCHGPKGHEFPYPGATHKSVGFFFGVDCVPCHDTGTTTGTYPVPNGTPPNCAGCHTRWGDATCSDCHGDLNPLGSDGFGQPTGTTFPNTIGRHRNHSDAGITTCTYCHFGGGTGATAHGNSNRTAKTVKDVIILKDPSLSSEAITISKNTSTGVVTCNGSCHAQGHSSVTW